MIMLFKFILHVEILVIRQVLTAMLSTMGLTISQMLFKNFC